LSVSRPRRLTIVQELIVALAIVGVTAHSVAVLAEGVDYLADAVAIGVFLLATSLSKHPPTPRRPLGYPKAAEIAALVNAGWLLALNVAVVFGASRRLLKGIPSELRQTPHLLPMSLRGGHSLQLNSLPYQNRLWRLQEAADPPVRAFPYEHALRNLALASRSWPGEDANFSAVRAQRSSISSRRTA